MLKAHPREEFIRFMDGELAGQELRHVEAHLRECGECRERLSFAQEFNAALGQVAAEELAVQDPCPDSWTLAALEAGAAEEETARHVRAHLLFCEECAEAYTALRRARPKHLELVLRIARGLVEALPMPGEAPVFVPARSVTRGALRQAFAAPFCASETLTDDEGQTSQVTLRVENAIRSPEDHVRVVVECDPSPGRWRARLSEAEDTELVDLPFAQRQIELSPELEHGFYVLSITKDGDSVGGFAFTVEPFSLPEAVEAALGYLELRDYNRALAVLDGAVRRYPEDKDLWQLRCLAITTAANGTEEVLEGDAGEEARYGEAVGIRGIRDLVREAWQALGEAKTRFGESLATCIGGAVLEPAIVRDNAAAILLGQPPSLPVLRAVELLNTRLVAIEGRIAQLVPILDEVHARLDRFSASLDTLRDAVAAVRGEPEPDSDDKFQRIGQLLEQFVDHAVGSGVSLSHYESSLAEQLGQECWSWLDPESSKIFASAEAMYRYLGGQPARDAPDFSPALLQLCRGLELLCNFKLKHICSAIAEAVGGSNGVMRRVTQQFPRMDIEQTLRIGRTISLTQTANLLAIGRTVKVIPGALPGSVQALLSASPSLANAAILVPLAQTGIFFRNRKMHPDPKSPSLFTSAKEMHVLRKLAFGRDEYRVDSRDYLERLGRANWWWFSEIERENAVEQISGQWRKYPGVVNALWTTLREHRWP